MRNDDASSHSKTLNGDDDQSVRQKNIKEEFKMNDKL